MADLPFELILNIIECAYYDSRGEPDHKTLSSAALVCKLWRLPSQRLLFHAVTARFRKSANSFAHATNRATLTGARLGDTVRVLDINIGTHTHAAHSISTRQFIKLVSLCPRLYQLVIYITGLHAFGNGDIDDLELLFLEPGRSPLRALTLRYCGVQSPVLYQLLGVWPSVRFLRLESELAAPPPSAPARCALYELALHRILRLPVFTWLLSGTPPGALQVAQFRDAPGCDYDAVLLNRHGAHLRSLRLGNYNFRAKGIIARCKRLEDLVVHQLSGFFPIANLPSTLEHLGIRSFMWKERPSLQQVVDAIEDLPKLKVLTFDPNAAEHEEFPLVQNKCAEKCIELRIDTRPFWMMDDPVHAFSFPRIRSITNFALMNDNAPPPPEAQLDPL